MEAITVLTTFLQTCITPIVLISGVGLILLSVTNRMGRTIDRSRILIRELHAEVVRDEERKLRQLEVLYKRSTILKYCIMAITFSILCSSLIIVVLLLMSLFPVDLAVVGKILFLLSVAGIISSAIFLMVDVTMTLKALDHEMRAVKK